MVRLDGADDGPVIETDEWLLTGCAQVQGCSQAEQIGAGVDILAVQLLRSHVGRRTHSLSRFRQPIGSVGCSGQSEVEDAGSVGAGVEPDVRRLDVAMHQPAPVGGGQPGRHFAAQSNDLGNGQAAGSVQPRLQRLALQQRHDDERHAAILLDMENGHHIIMFDHRRGSGLAQEAGLGKRIAQPLRQHHLESHAAIEPIVLSFEDHTHAAVADLPDDPIFVEVWGRTGPRGGP